MHIQFITSGRKNQYIKVLLRESYREGKRVKKRTLANLSYWPNKAVVRLQDALMVKRRYAGAPLEEEANNFIFQLVQDLSDCSRFPVGLFQVYSSLLKGQGKSPFK